MRLGNGWELAMVAEQEAPNTDTETFQPSPLDGSTSAEPAGGAIMDRLAGLDVRAQSALLQEAFEMSDPSELDTPTRAVSPKWCTVWLARVQVGPRYWCRHHCRVGSCYHGAHRDQRLWPPICRGLCKRSRSSTFQSAHTMKSGLS
jgi:hypothetical protein